MNFMMKAAIVAILVSFVFPTVWAAPAYSEHPDTSREDYVTVILQRIYLDGEVSEEYFNEHIDRLAQMLHTYEDWQLVDRDDMQIVLQKRIDDISPLLKTSGYFGVSKEGVLQIFRGVPKVDHVIHSFFQIDMGKLKSYEREKLQRGIRIKSKKRYVEVLQQLRNYSTRTD